MKTLNKVENVIIAFVIAFVRIALMCTGLMCIVDDVCYALDAEAIVAVVSVIIAYCETRWLIFKVIQIVREQ